MAMITSNLRTGRIQSTVGTHTSNPTPLVTFVPTPGDIDDLVTGSFLLAVSGFTTAITVPVLYKYSAAYQLAFLFLPAIMGTSNVNTFTAIPLPQQITPLTLTAQEANIVGFDNGQSQSIVDVLVGASNLLTFRVNRAATGWTATGQKGTQPQVVALFTN